MGYKILDDELQVLEAIGEFRDVNDNFVGYNHRANLYYKGEVVPDEKVSPLIRQALEEKDENDETYRHLEGRIEKVSENKEAQDTAKRLGLPFADYDKLDEDQVVAALRVLPSTTGQIVKEYESQQENPRTRILEFNLGLREGVDDRIRGEAGSEGQVTEVKPTSEIQTREVGESDVRLGEGITGSDPERPTRSGRKTKAEKASEAAASVAASDSAPDAGKDKSGGSSSRRQNN